MKKQQLYTRLGPDVVERIIRRFNNREISMEEAMDALGVSRPQVYNLRTQWLSAGKSASFLGSSGGDRKEAWPSAAVEHLEKLIQASKDDGPNYELYADELARVDGFIRDRSSVRKYCEKHLMPLLRSVFPMERKKLSERHRRWESSSYGSLWQHDSTPRHIWGAEGDTSCEQAMSRDDPSRWSHESTFRGSDVSGDAPVNLGGFGRKQKTRG